MDARLDKIIDLLLLNQGTATGPSPFRKKTRHEDHLSPDMEIDHFEQLSSNIDNAKESQEEPKSPERGSTPTIPTPLDTEMKGPSDQKHNDALNNEYLPPLPDSPTQEDHTWLKRNTNAAKAFNAKAKILLNPYRTAREELSLTTGSRLSLLNTPSTSPGVHLTTLPSSRRDTASRGREE